MGCDIHMFVEKYDPVNNSWKKIGKVFFDNYLASMFIEEMIDTFGVDEEEAWEMQWLNIGIMYPLLIERNNIF